MVSMNVEVVYASESEQAIIPLDVPLESTVAFAIEKSGVLQRFSEIDLTKNTVGIFSQRVTLDTVLNENDRIEIYRVLKIDPKQKRRMKVKRDSQ